MESKWPLIGIALAAMAFGLALAIAGGSWASAVLGAAFAFCVLLGVRVLWVAYGAKRERDASRRDASRGPQ
jgi:uncharacterized membrane protein YhaH (DUF805 family)